MIIIFSLSLFLLQDPGSLPFNSNRQLVLIDGFDLVSYQEDGPRQGTNQFSLEYKGVILYFENAGNRTEFISNPEKYFPAYGGWCAYAMGLSGEKVKIDPYTFKLVDSKLYLFYNFRGNNTLIDWNKQEDKLVVAANQYWEKLIKSRQ